MANVVLIYAIMLITLGRGLDFFPVLAPFQLAKVVLALALLHVLALEFPSLKRTLRSKPFTPSIGLLILLAGCGIPFSVWRGGAFGTFILYLKTVCVFMVLCALAGDRRAGAMRTAAVATVGMLAALMLADKGTGRIRVSATYDPNDIALLFVTFLPFAVTEALAGNRLLRLPAWGVAGAALVSVALTQSRGGIIALAAVGIHALLLAGKRAWLLVPAVGAAALIILVHADPQLWERFQGLHSRSDYNFSDRGGRLEIWKEGLQIMLRRPLLGVGIGQFSSALSTLGSGIYKAAHNSFIQIGAELGIAGLCVYSAMLLRIRRFCRDALADPDAGRAFRLRWHALLLALTGFAAGSLFLSQAYSGILYTLLALAVAMQAERQRETTLRTAETRQKNGGPARIEAQEEKSLAARAARVRAAREALLSRGDARHTAGGRKP